MAGGGNGAVAAGGGGWSASGEVLVGGEPVVLDAGLQRRAQAAIVGDQRPAVSAGDRWRAASRRIVGGQRGGGPATGGVRERRSEELELVGTELVPVAAGAWQNQTARRAAT